MAVLPGVLGPSIEYEAKFEIRISAHLLPADKEPPTNNDVFPEKKLISKWPWPLKPK
jgi:hypothetical protein